MFEKLRFISLKRLKIHEFNTTLRLFDPAEQVWFRKSEIAAEIQKDATKSFLVCCGQLFIAYLVLSSLRSGTEASITVSNVTAAVPATYAFVTTSLLTVLAALQFDHLSAAIAVKVNLSKRLFPHGFHTNSYDFLKSEARIASRYRF